jgi:copper(I)-binding protein
MWMRKSFVTFIFIITATIASSAHESQNHTTLEISNVWARKTGNRTLSAAVYFDVHNKSKSQELLTGVSTDRASNAMMHRSFEEDNIMRMEMQTSISIAGGETLKFAPGGYHVMLTKLTAPLVEGDTFPITLSFKDAGDVTVYVDVTGISGPNNH